MRRPAALQAGQRADKRLANAIVRDATSHEIELSRIRRVDDRNAQNRARRDAEGLQATVEVDRGRRAAATGAVLEHSAGRDLALPLLLEGPFLVGLAALGAGTQVVG